MHLNVDVSDRGYLPHIHSECAVQSVTWNLADAIPPGLWRMIVLDSEALPEAERAVHRRDAVDRLYRRGLGSRLLSNPIYAQIVADSIRWVGRERAQVYAWVVMPSHVHLLLRTHENLRLGDVMRSLKGYTARLINEARGQSGRLWQVESYDHLVRSQEEFERVRSYIEQNPVVAGLVAQPEDYPFSSKFQPSDGR